MNALLVALVSSSRFFAFSTPQQGVVIPAPAGFVNDFAGVIDDAREQQIDRLVQFVRNRSGGEIAVVTLRDIGGRDPQEIALRIGREWRVGLNAPVGNRARNAGVVILVVPKETARDGRGRVRVEVGQGAEGFISDGVAGDIWRAAIPLLERQDYSAAIELMAYRVAQRFAAEFAFSLDSAGVPVPRSAQRPPTRGDDGIPVGPFFVMIAILFFVVIPALSAQRRYGRRSRGNLGVLPWLILNAMQSGSTRRRGRSGWSGGGFGGGGGGGFGGFGGGGGFSGGGSGGSW